MRNYFGNEEDHLVLDYFVYNTGISIFDVFIKGIVGVH